MLSAERMPVGKAKQASYKAALYGVFALLVFSVGLAVYIVCNSEHPSWVSFMAWLALFGGVFVCLVRGMPDDEF